MGTFRKRVIRRLSIGFSTLVLVIVLAACGGSGGGTGSATPTPTAAPSPTPTTATSSQLYTGDGFTIQYPQSWKVQTNQNTVIFTDALMLNTLTILIVPNPGGAISSSQQADVALSTVEKAGGISNAQPVSGLPATATVGGESWVQRGITGTVTSNGVSVPGELILLATNHPANSPTTKTFEIYYAGPSASFQQINQAYFQPMLLSFKFTA